MVPNELNGTNAAAVATSTPSLLDGIRAELRTWMALKISELAKELAVPVLVPGLPGLPTVGVDDSAELLVNPCGFPESRRKLDLSIALDRQNFDQCWEGLLEAVLSFGGLFGPALQQALQSFRHRMAVKATRLVVNKLVGDWKEIVEAGRTGFSISVEVNGDLRVMVGKIVVIDGQQVGDMEVEQLSRLIRYHGDVTEALNYEVGWRISHAEELIPGLFGPRETTCT